MELDQSQILAQIQQLKPGKKIRFGKVLIVHNRTRHNYTIILDGHYIEADCLTQMPQKQTEKRKEQKNMIRFKLRTL